MRQFLRRQFLIAASALLASQFAQTQDRLRRIGCLFGGSPKTHTRALDAFRLALKEYGWVEDRNVAFELRWAESKMDRVPALAADLVRTKPDVILTAANVIIAEVKKATQTIPIVMATGADPVEWGLATSLARPGGNVTGLSGFYESTPIKMLELVGALVLRGAHVAALLETNTPFSRARYRQEFAITAKMLELRTEFLDVTTADDVARVLDALGKTGPLH
jgi:putative tryptophan/tyrosine transport system substrate-binding protein